MLAAVLASLRFTLSTGKDFSKTLAENRSVGDELTDFQNGVGDYMRPWIPVDNDVLIARDAIVAVTVTREPSY
jgi:hypothetical protein